VEAGNLQRLWVKCENSSWALLNFWICDASLIDVDLFCSDLSHLRTMFYWMFVLWWLEIGYVVSLVMRRVNNPAHWTLESPVFISIKLVISICMKNRLIALKARVITHNALPYISWAGLSNLIHNQNRRRKTLATSATYVKASRPLIQFWWLMTQQSLWLTCVLQRHYELGYNDDWLMGNQWFSCLYWWIPFWFSKDMWQG
jgi:hypothetical protein